MRAARLLVGLWLAAGGGLGLLPSLAAPAEPAPGTYDYRIRHGLFRDIGEHHVTVRREAGAVVVEHAAELAVELLGLTAFQRRTRFREVWRDDRLIAFEGLVEDNGEPFPVTARAVGDHLLIEGRAGRIEAPPGTAPSEPSLARDRARVVIRQQDRRAPARDGDPGRPRVAQGRAGRGRSRPVRDHGRARAAGVVRRYGVFVQWRLWRQGAAITLTRER